MSRNSTSLVTVGLSSLLMRLISSSLKTVLTSAVPSVSIDCCSFGIREEDPWSISRGAASTASSSALTAEMSGWVSSGGFRTNSGRWSASTASVGCCTSCSVAVPCGDCSIGGVSSGASSSTLVAVGASSVVSSGVSSGTLVGASSRGVSSSTSVAVCRISTIEFSTSKRLITFPISESGSISTSGSTSRSSGTPRSLSV